MLHVISDIERREIQRALNEAGVGVWEKLSSEIDFQRNQVYFWFLINENENLKPSVEISIKILKSYARNQEGVEFNASFTKFDDQLEIELEVLDDEEIRNGKIDREPGTDPVRRKRKDYTVFDFDT